MSQLENLLLSVFFFISWVNFIFLDVNECLNLTICHNGGECINKVGSYACSCKEGWTGQHCHIGIQRRIFRWKAINILKIC